jgi:lipoprotein-anchoring transpeptidase ErfK/SrfK
MTSSLSRRLFLLGAGSASALALGACSGMSRRFTLSSYAPQTPTPRISDYYVQMYAARPQERFPIPAVDLRQLNPDFWRADVPDPTGERPGTIVVSTAERYLYLVQEGGRAIRYGVGIGREGFTWSGRGFIGRKAEWPVWTPPPEMIRRQPELEQYRNGQAPGLDNPLGARAMYIFRDGGGDSGYRIHGSPEWWSIGKAVSSGCVRLVNQDVIDLYGRVPVGTKVLVT